MSSDRATPDLTFVNLIHRALRVDGERLKVTVAALSPDDAQDRVAGVRDIYDKYREQLIAHHTHEDDLFFPALAAHVGAERMHLAELIAQHHQLDDVLRSIEEGPAEGLVPLGAALVDRLPPQPAKLPSPGRGARTGMSAEER